MGIFFSFTHKIQGARYKKSLPSLYAGLLYRHISSSERSYSSALPFLYMSPSSWNYLESSSYGRLHPKSPTYNAALLVAPLIESDEKELWTFNGSPLRFCPDNKNRHLPLAALHKYTEDSFWLEDTLYTHKAWDYDNNLYLGRPSINLAFKSPILGMRSGSLLIFDRASDIIIKNNYSATPTNFDPDPLLLDESILISKGGDRLEVESKSVTERMKMKRCKSQNAVMQGPATAAYENFYQRNARFLQESLKNYSLLSLQAGALKNNTHSFYPEWCHLYSFALTPLGINPQRRENLGAAPRWLNNQMLLCEKVLASLAQISLSTFQTPLILSLCSKFWSYIGESVVLKSQFHTSMQYGSSEVHTYQNLECIRPQVFSRAHDSAAIATVILDVLNGTPILQPQSIRTAGISFLKYSPSK